jgi:zinc protease
VSRDDCQRYLAASLRPHGARLYVVGDVTRTAIEQQIGGRLAGWKGTPAPTAVVGPPQPQSGKLYFVDVPGAAQSYVLLAEAAPPRQAPDYHATGVMMGILGGAFSSRINANLRETRGWSYGGGAYIRYTRSTGQLRAGASVRADATAGAVRELYREIDRMAGGAVTPQELRREKNGESLALPAQFATGEGILATYRELLFFGLPLDWYASYAAMVEAVSPAAVAEAARQHLDPAALRVLVVGDGKTVLPALQELLRSGDIGRGALVRLDADGQAVVSH